MDAEFIRELFAQFRPVDVRRMFGGIGLFADGAMFGLEFSGVIYLRADETTVADFEREGSTPFIYPLAKSEHRLRRPSMRYWRLPERLYDDPDELAQWAAAALIAAQQKKSKTRGSSAKGSSAKRSKAKAKSAPPSRPRKRPPKRR